MGDCEKTCSNYNIKCDWCENQSAYKSKFKTKSRPSSMFSNVNNVKDLNKENSWENLESTVANELNKVPTIQEARRSRASGALWFERGDIVDSILHPECKERTAEKSFSIKKEWLDKAYNECKYEDKFMCLPFRFKGDDKIYTVMRNEDLMELITLMKSYIGDNDRLRNILKQHGIEE